MAKRPCTGQAGSNENPSVIAVLTAGRWQSPSMPGRHARGQLAAPRGAVAEFRYGGYDSLNLLTFSLSGVPLGPRSSSWRGGAATRALARPRRQADAGGPLSSRCQTSPPFANAPTRAVKPAKTAGEPSEREPRHRRGSAGVSNETIAPPGPRYVTGLSAREQ